MVPSIGSSCRTVLNFPRIRGDGPCCRGGSLTDIRFSPYSRGWSPNLRTWSASASIFPVFAGMVLMRNCMPCSLSHFPRIRGDGPPDSAVPAPITAFSPYSRGWSLPAHMHLIPGAIFPVFAGMVLLRDSSCSATSYFPRIRGDGPMPLGLNQLPCVFSPYSRGWSPHRAGL